LIKHNKYKNKDKNKTSEDKSMINQTTYVTRRGVTSNSFARNRNTVRHTKRSLGSISQIVIVSMLTLIFGLIYVAEGTKATSFDYELSSVESEISEMTTRKDDLAVEKARLNSVATAKSSTVAANMEDAVVSGYATE
jgi:cell division protein FtsL